MITARTLPFWLLFGPRRPIRWAGEHGRGTSQTNQWIRPVAGAHTVAGVLADPAAGRHHRRTAAAGFPALRTAPRRPHRTARTADPQPGYLHRVDRAAVPGRNPDHPASAGAGIPVAA